MQSIAQVRNPAALLQRSAVDRQRAAACILVPYLTDSLPVLFPSVFNNATFVVPVDHQGHLNATFFARGIDAKEYIIKVCQPATWLDRNPKETATWSRFQKEQYFLNKLRQLDGIGPLVPEIPGIAYLPPDQLPASLFELEGVRRAVPYALSVQTRLPGVPLWPLLRCMPEGELLDCMAKLGEITRAIHSVSTHGIGKDFDQRSSMFTDYRSAWKCLDQLLASCQLDTLVENGFINQNLRNKLQVRFETYRDSVKDPCLSHGDTHAGNILYLPEQKAISGLIDWELISSIASNYQDLGCQLVRTLEVCDGDPIAIHSARLERFIAFLRGYGLGDEPYQGDHKRDILTAALLEILPTVASVLQEQATTSAGAGAKEQRAHSDHLPFRKRRFEIARSLIAEADATFD